MAGQYKQCPNGHYYQGDTCPYCKTNVGAGSATSMKTEVYGGFGGGSPEVDTHGPTMPMGGSASAGRTTVVDGGETIVSTPGARPSAGMGGGAPMSGRTVFGDEDEVETVATPQGERVQRVYREARRIVGWLVSYTLDPMGVDFRLYEGRNVIGRDQDCNITVNDNMVSARHAVLLFRAGKYSITDSQSSHGTFVNNEDIELDPRYLQDGDTITVGQTVFKFRTSF